MKYNKEYHRRLIKTIRIAFEVLAGVVLSIGMIAMLAGAVLQESFRNYPPTSEELEENPELARYK